MLARGAKLSVFDEPEAGIDLWSFKNLIEVFQGLRREIKGSSIVIISHQERILAIADTVVLLRNGVLAGVGSRDEILPTLTGTNDVASGCKQTLSLKGGISL